MFIYPLDYVKKEIPLFRFNFKNSILLSTLLLHLCMMSFLGLKRIDRPLRLIFSDLGRRVWILRKGCCRFFFVLLLPSSFITNPSRKVSSQESKASLPLTNFNWKKSFYKFPASWTPYPPPSPTPSSPSPPTPGMSVHLNPPGRQPPHGSPQPEAEARRADGGGTMPKPWWVRHTIELWLNRGRVTLGGMGWLEEVDIFVHKSLHR